MESIYKFIESLQIEPALVVGFFVGLLVSWGATQAIKRTLRWSGAKPRVTAALMAFFATYTVAGSQLHWSWICFWTAVAAALLSPLLYKLLVAFARHRWEWVRNLSVESDR